MRILFTFAGGNGHFRPLVPVAKAGEAAGHSVAFACAPSMLAIVETAGFRVFPLGTLPTSAPERKPLRPVDAAREDQEFRERFARYGAWYRALHVIGLCADWQPDALVCDETDFGSMIAAERLGLPYATALVTASGAFVRTQVISEVLNELRAEHGLPPDSELEMLRRYLVLSPFPPSFRDAAHALPATAYSFRPAISEGTARPALAWSSMLPNAPMVYFTLGTVFNLESGDLFARVIAGLRELPINVAVTVGHHIDPMELGPQPRNVCIERYVAQESILPHCRLVVSHGGSGSVMGALASGLPLVLIPMGADQPLNAARCVQLGVAQMLDPFEATPETVRASVSDVLGNPSYRRAAERIRDEFAVLPRPPQAIKLFERLVAEKRQFPA